MSSWSNLHGFAEESETSHGLQTCMVAIFTFTNSSLSPLMESIGWMPTGIMRLNPEVCHPDLYEILPITTMHVKCGYAWSGGPVMVCVS